MKCFIGYILAAVLTMISLVGSANGLHDPGIVNVNTSGSFTAVTGRYNVRYNSDVTKGYIRIAGNVGSSVTVQAQDSTTGAYFTCFVFSSDLAFAAAEKVLYSGPGNGATVTAWQSGGKCTSVAVDYSSTFLD